MHDELNKNIDIKILKRNEMLKENKMLRENKNAKKSYM